MLLQTDNREEKTRGREGEERGDWREEVDQASQSFPLIVTISPSGNIQDGREKKRQEKERESGEVNRMLAGEEKHIMEKKKEGYESRQR